MPRARFGLASVSLLLDVPGYRKLPRCCRSYVRQPGESRFLHGHASRGDGADQARKTLVLSRFC